ncbi:hypothetical protein HOO54_02070 [Bacillus sp. WMMC1349]|uniref:hypothetical protein n=1 Tax=Bacillus sp. WMMC1349 TaxID=2736254 RepID=UPI001557081E|nr:hypothetical protein [Bacillus sp. WMMC1349]NPC90794.1 hypothetical protein [Bacillus sp. WMMC1349]NPC90982.1 hypothetical protein [Bacillus sp. WMMC1349]NPC91080.1 hypothetical protein [Bacillus sp. WMMC1349]
MKQLIVSLLSLSLLVGIVSPLTTLASASELPSQELSNDAVVKKAAPITSSVLPEGTVLGDDKKADTAGKWRYYATSKYSNKIVWTTVSAAATAMGLYTGIKHLTLAGIVGNYIIANYNDWIYYTDRKYWRMAGFVRQVKHRVTWYKDRKRKKKIHTQEYITNDYGGPKSVPSPAINN